MGSYELLAKVRDGGMATLYLARRTGVSGFSRHVAIKVVHADLANDEQFRQMFLDEALLSSRIQHPNVVHVEELGQHGSAHFLVMEYVHGCSLSMLQRALLERRRRLAPAFAARIAMHVAEGLHAAHEARDERGRLLNVVHRDVTPENVLLAYAGHVKLIDFGIAKAFGRKHRTQDGLLKGKFRYMAPEQALGRPVDRRVDIYQLGIVLWEMLTLRRLFDAERDVDLLASVQRPRIAPPSSVVDRIPPALDAAVMCALDPDPRGRPADAESFARMLGQAMPEARDVDAGALRLLLEATMREQRQRDRGTYPLGVYDGLERQLETLPIAGPLRDQAPARVLLSHTLSHAPAALSAGDAPTRPGPGAARLAPAVRAMPPLPPRVEPRRPRRFARAERIEAPAVDRRSATGKLGLLVAALRDLGPVRTGWFSVLLAIGVAGALALLTIALRAPARSPVVPRVPDLPIVESVRARAEPTLHTAVGSPRATPLPARALVDASVGPAMRATH